MSYTFEELHTSEKQDEWNNKYQVINNTLGQSATDYVLS